MDRREFLYSVAGAAGLVAVGGGLKVAGGSDSLLRPPGGQDESRLVGACLHCERCRSICPKGCIAEASLEDGFVNIRTPKLNFQRGWCDFCGKCVEVCPTQSLVSFDASTEKLGVAVLDSALCVNCTKCKDCCPMGAIAWDEDGQMPIVDEEKCNGCGLCEYICPSASYGTAGNAHRRAIAVERMR